MERIENIEKAEQKVLSDASDLLSELSKLSSVIPQTAEEAVGTLAQIRDIAYENLNQIQHEYLILVAAKYLLESGAIPKDPSWGWNPRQTGGAEEPDLQATVNGNVAVSAEITTSRRPIGTIAEHMKSTLSKLNGFQGDKYYFVRTEAMAKKARAICAAAAHRITVVHLPHTVDEL
jgi:hypothetical protein